MSRLAITLVLLLAPAAAQAVPTGPTLLGGAVITLQRDQGDVHFGTFLGPTARVAWEVGDFWTSEFSVQATRASGQATAGSTHVDTTLTSIAGGYQLTLDILKKASFLSPYAGAGFLVGDMYMDVNAQSLGSSQVARGNAFYLELHALAGLRMNFPFGLGVRAECAFSTYGGFFAFQPSLGAAYSF